MQKYGCLRVLEIEVVLAFRCRYEVPYVLRL